MQSIYDKGCDELTDESMATGMCAMQSTYEKGCDELTDESGSTDICAHCAADDKLQPALYFCFQCGPFGRYMCGDCNRQHRQFAYKHEARSISTAAQQTRQTIDIGKRGRDTAEDENGPIDVCAHCAFDNKIQRASYFCFHCGPFGRYMCEKCNKLHKKFAQAHEFEIVINKTQETRWVKQNISSEPRQRLVPAVRQTSLSEVPTPVTQWEATAIRITDFGARPKRRQVTLASINSALNIHDKTAYTAEKFRDSKNSTDPETETQSVLLCDQGNSPNKQKKPSKIKKFLNWVQRKQSKRTEKEQKPLVPLANKELDLVEKQISDPIRWGFIVAAINIGTECSGCAFSLAHKPLEIRFLWKFREYTTIPTCVLFDKNMKFHSFGVEAENNYDKFASEGIQRHYYFFRGFNMIIFEKMKLKQELVLEDEMGKKMHAMDVMSACIKFFRDRFTESMPDCIKCQIEDSDILWVLTVPAFWDDASQQFMREAAQKAEINDQQLLIAKEPEVVSLYCRYLRVDDSTRSDGEFELFARNSKHLILDVGDRTHITAYEVKNDGALKELCMPTDVDLGFMFLNKVLRDFLVAIFGKDVMDNLQNVSMICYIHLLRDLKSKYFNIEMTETISIKVPVAVLENVGRKGINDYIMTKPEYKDKVEVVGDKLRINSEIIKRLLKETYDRLAYHLKFLFSKPGLEDVSTILMVGGFSESTMLQDLIMKTFPNKRIVISSYGDLAVLQGAVIFGHATVC